MNASDSVQNDVIGTLAELVAINSVNPEWHGPGEERVVHFIQQFFARFGIETWTRQVLPNRCNVYARLPGRDVARCLILEAHMDTVSADGMDIPAFDADVHDGKLWGRGACDVKAGLAAMMHAVVEVKQSGRLPACEILFAAVIDEEHLYRGVLSLIDELARWPANSQFSAVVAEPTECRIATTNKGVLRWTIQTIGRAAHSSKPELGRNAILDTVPIIQALQEESLKLSEVNHPRVGCPSLCISMIQGGRQINFVPDQCTISIDRRLNPGECAQLVLNNYQRLLETLPGISFQMSAPLIVDEAMDTSDTQLVVQAAIRAAEHLGLNGHPCGVPFGCDATKLSRAGVPSIIFGPGSIDRAHGAIEYVEIDQVLAAQAFYRNLIEEFQ